MNDSAWAREALILAAVGVAEATEALGNARDRRDALIRSARADGVRGGAIAKWTGMSPGQVSRILNHGGDDAA